MRKILFILLSIKLSTCVVASNIEEKDTAVNYVRGKESHPLTYEKGAYNVGIPPLHQQLYYGQKVKVGLLDVCVDSKAQFCPTTEITNNLIEGSSSLLTDHSYNMLAVLAGKWGIIDAGYRIANNPSLAPDASIFYYYTKKWAHTLGLEDDEKYRLTKFSQIIEKERLLDIVLEDPEADQEIADFFESSRKKRVWIVNVSRDLLIGDISKKEIKRFVDMGGLIVISLGNGGFMFEPTGIEVSRLEDRGARVASFQYPLIKFLHQNTELQKGFVFVGALRLENDTYEIEDSCQPGDLISDRTIFAPSGWNSYVVTMGEGARTPYVSLRCTSGATVFVTGAITLLQSAFPKATPQEIAEILLETADKNSISVYTKKVYGQGVLDVKPAFNKVLKERYF